MVEAIPFEKWALSHDGGQRYGIMTTNMSAVFNSVLKRARSLPITALVHNEMDVREGKTTITYGFYKQPGHNS